MNYRHKPFMDKLELFRHVAEQPASVVCDTLGVSKKTYNRLSQAYRFETGGLTRNQSAAMNLQRFDEYTGDRDPQTISMSEYATALGITKGQAARYRSTLIRRRAAEADSQGPKLATQGPKPARVRDKDNPRKLIWVEDGRLYSKNREQQEVGA